MITLIPTVASLMATILIASQATPPSPSPDGSRFAEERCVFDELMALSSPVRSQAEFDAVVERCRVRYGWSEAKAHVDVAIGYASTDLASATLALQGAGVDPQQLIAIYERIVPADRLVLGNPSTYSTAEVRAATHRLAELIVQSHIGGETHQVSMFFAARAALDALLDRFHAMQ